MLFSRLVSIEHFPANPLKQARCYAPLKSASEAQPSAPEFMAWERQAAAESRACLPVVADGFCI
jgi:hypothetical protein